MSFISYLINGISLGSVYAIIALGYTMVYGIAKMLNFAHGDVIMVGSFAVFTIVSTLGLPPILGILVAVVVCTILGMAIERVAYKPLRNAASPLAVLITAIGVSYQYEIFYIGSYHQPVEIGRWTADDIGGDHRHHYSWDCNYDLPYAICQ